MLKSIILSSIKFYQKTLSPDHGLFSFYFPYCGCRFYPTCSEYAYQAISHYGLKQGIFLGFKRILKCHPFSQGGYDPLKIQKSPSTTDSCLPQALASKAENIKKG